MDFNAFLALIKKNQPVSSSVISLPIGFEEFYRRVLHDRDAAAFDNFVVVSIAIHKSTGSMQHECVVVKFTDVRRISPAHGAGPSCYCLLERAGSDGRDVRSGSSDTVNTSAGTSGARDELVFASTLAHLLANKPEMQPTPEAYATFTPTSLSPNVLDYTFSQIDPAQRIAYTPTLRHLARVTLAFHLTSPDYRMAVSNCYTFAHSVFHLMVDLFPPLRLSVDGNAAGTWRNIQVGNPELYGKSKMMHSTMDTGDFYEARQRELEAARSH